VPDISSHYGQLSGISNRRNERVVERGVLGNPVLS